MKPLSILIAILCFVQSYSQEDSPKIKFHSISFSAPNVYAAEGEGGISVSLEAGISKDPHIFKLTGYSGSQVSIAIWGPSKTISFSALDLLYGREFMAKKWLYFDFYGGLGYFGQTLSDPERIEGSSDYDYHETTTSTIDFPVQMKLRFKTGQRFSLGLQMHLNINSVNTTTNFGLFYQWSFN